MNPTVQTVLAIATVVIGAASLVQGIMLWFVNGKASKINTLEGTVTKKAEEAIDAKFQILTVTFKAMVEQLSVVVGKMEKRLADGDDKFDQQGEGQHKIELKLQTQLGETRDWTMRTFGTRAELAGLTEQVQELRVKVATFEAMVKRH